MHIRWGKMIAAAAAIGCGVVVGTMLTAMASGIPTAGQPGSAEDPVVTKSYVDEQIRNALNGDPVGQSQQPPSNQASGTASVPYAVVKLQAGHTLIGEMGTEFIVRTGQAYIHSSPENGIADVTDGVDLANDTLIPKNHLLMVPREGRGVKVKADYPNDVYVTIKGNYVEVDIEGNPVNPE